MKSMKSLRPPPPFTTNEVDRRCGSEVSENKVGERVGANAEAKMEEMFKTTVFGTDKSQATFNIILMGQE
jgi:hypothetical protein